MPPMVSMDRVTRSYIQQKHIPCAGVSCQLASLYGSARATHSSGFRVLLGSCPVSCFTFSCTAGIRVGSAYPAELFQAQKP